MQTLLAEMEHRARRNRIPNEHRESRIVRAFEDPHEDYLLVADMLGVNRSTARGIVATYVREGPLMSNTPKLSRIVLKQRRFESARGSKTSDSPEVRLAELDLPEVRSRINAQGGEKF